MSENRSVTGGSNLASANLPSVEDVKAWKGYQLDEISGQGVAKVEGLFVDFQSPISTCNWLYLCTEHSHLLYV